MVTTPPEEHVLRVDLLGGVHLSYQSDIVGVEVSVIGVRAVLDALTIPSCIASNGPVEKMEVSLRVTGLWDYFEGRIVSAYRVGSFKPLPGLFLAAADLLGVEPNRCAVVEDSLPGIEAGVAANMSVFAICPPDERQRFEEQGARPFGQMSELLALLQGPPSQGLDRIG